MCKYGVHCRKRDCYFQHPDDRNPIDHAVDPEPFRREPPAQQQCRHGSACRNPACTFGHPPDWDPPAENQALCVVKSHPLGKSLHNKMTGDGWYGDKLEKLNNKVGATVTYLELECRLRVQVPFDQAPHAQKCMNRAIDESRPRLSGESNELNVVGTTRVVVGRGGQVLCVLPGREVRAFDALLDHGSNGQVRREDLQATKDIMGRFVTPNADGTSPRPSVQPLHGKMRIIFHKPEDAQSALDASPPGPWMRLKPFIQPPREGTVVKVLELKITYPLAVRPNRERQVIILQQLAPFEVRMHDIEMSRGNSETGTGTATVHMWSKSNADAALLHLQTYARRNNELASRPGELDVQLQSGFRVYVARKQYMALEEKLRALQSKQRNSISIHIKAPQHDRDLAVIELIKQQEDRPADKEDLLRARKDIEAVLRGVVIQLDRETMQALPTKQLKEQLETVEEEFGGQVAILTEMESSRVRLFGSTSLDDSSMFRANPLKEAHNTTTQLIVSLKHNKQPSFVVIPANTRNWLLRGLPNTMPALRDALQKQLGNLAGVQVDRAEEKDGGAAEVKLVGSPAANLEAEKLLDDLQSAAGSSFFSELVDSTRPAPDTTCAICWSEIEPAERHLMEPCLHAYHKECAVRNVKSALEERKLPVMCQHQGCAPQPVCMEDIKLLLGDNSDYEKLCTRALMLHVNQNPALGRCPTVNCKQVFKAHVIKFECNHCLETYCTQCNGMPRWHEGKTCQQFQEMISTNNKSEQWISQNTRKCGNCRAPFFKLDGCNHLQCGACRRDLCNLCGETFPDASATYSHLRARHGGYYTTA